MWGFGTQVNQEQARSQEGGFFTPRELPTIKQLIRFLEVYQMR
jgi:hypothetical protein